MARLRVTLAPFRGHRPPSDEGRSPRVNIHKCLILLGITAGLSLSACGGAASTQQSARIADLESYTLQLESQLTVLKERSLEQERSHCKTSGVRTATGVKANSEAEPAFAAETGSGTDPPIQAKTESKASGAPADLPVVHLAPGGPTAAMRENSAAFADEQEDTEQSQKGDAEDSTRPVLKIHGSQDGQVYHRPLTNADRQQTPSP